MVKKKKKGKKKENNVTTVEGKEDPQRIQFGRFSILKKSKAFLGMMELTYRT